MLEADEEYITLVYNHSPTPARREWIVSKKSGWDNFYLFLEERAKVAKSLLTDKSIVKTLMGTQSKDMWKISRGKM